jgi:hypothetical protein
VAPQKKPNLAQDLNPVTK